MRHQSVDKVQGNNFIAENIGANAELKHKIFHHFFAVQDPITTPPPKERCPNYKVDSFFRWLQHIWKKAWLLGPRVSADEQTTSMQGKSEYKVCCGKCKRIGDGIQADCIVDDGYTWDFYFRNEPVLIKWTDLGFCPMHARLLHMLSNSRTTTTASTWTTCSTEQLYGKRADAAHGTVKVAVLQGDSHADAIIIASCYGQKPFYMISSIAKEITWNTVSRKNVAWKCVEHIMSLILAWDVHGSTPTQTGPHETDSRQWVKIHQKEEDRVPNKPKQIQGEVEDLQSSMSTILST
eukprot:8871977-Ditylum_brightwellii.AAC.1